MRLSNASPTDPNSAKSQWLLTLPETIDALADRWSLIIGSPFCNGDEGNAWVAPVTDGRHRGRAAALKISFPHFEEEHEIRGLRFWDGNPTVMLLDADEDRHASLLELCSPGTPLSGVPELEQDTVIAALLRRLWRIPEAEHCFRPLSVMLAEWSKEAEASIARTVDLGLVREGLMLFRQLAESTERPVLLATDLHAGNVLRAEREQWLVIDPKPFVGDPAYDATQHLLNCVDRVVANPRGTIERFARLLEVDPERVRLWTFARAAVASATESPAEQEHFRRMARVLRP